MMLALNVTTGVSGTCAGRLRRQPEDLALPMTMKSTRKQTAATCMFKVLQKNVEEGKKHTVAYCD